MNEEKDFETITLSNIWIKEHILDVIKEINKNEIIAESGGLDLISLNELEAIQTLRLRIDALNLMKAYILQLRDNVAQYIEVSKKIIIFLKLKNIDNHEELLQNNSDQISHDDNYFLSSDFQTKLNRLREIKSILIDACGEAELLMPKRDQDTKGKRMGRPK